MRNTDHEAAAHGFEVRRLGRLKSVLLNLGRVYAGGFSVLSQTRFEHYYLN